VATFDAVKAQAALDSGAQIVHTDHPDKLLCLLDPSRSGCPISMRRYIGTHNSYHKQPGQAVIGALNQMSQLGGDYEFLGKLATDLSYTHPTLTEQLAMGLNTFELDVFADPQGGLYKEPGVVKAQLAPALTDQEKQTMERPGFKIMHIQDLDYLTNTPGCLTLKGCLEILKNYPRKSTMYVLLEVKTDTPPNLNGAPFTYTTAMPMTNDLWAVLEAEVRELATSTPPVVFLIDNGGTTSKAYMDYRQTQDAGAPGAAAVLVPNIQEETTFPANWTKTQVYLKCNSVLDSAGQPAKCFMEKTVAEVVGEGYLVRTRSDDVATFDAVKAQAALDSGAQIVHTDHPDKLISQYKNMTEVRMKEAQIKTGCTQNGCKYSCVPSCEPAPAPGPVPSTPGCSDSRAAIEACKMARGPFAWTCDADEMKRMVPGSAFCGPGTRWDPASSQCIA